MDQLFARTLLVLDCEDKVQLYLSLVTHSKGNSEAKSISASHSNCKWFVLKSGDVDDADVLTTNDKDEREICLIKLGHRECKSSLDIGSV